MRANQTNQKILPALTVTLTILALLLSCCFAAAQSESVGTVLKSFAAQKENQAESLAGGELPPEFHSFFSAIQNDNWESASNDYFKMKFLINEERTYHRSWWQPVVETYGAEEQLKCGEEKYFTAYANDIIQSVPSGSLYFGGTDPARFIITAMQKSQINGDPFFTLTQNALADGTYIDYLRSTYGDRIYIPTAEDSQECFNDYYADIQVRMRNNQLQPGENVSVDPGTGKMQVSGQVAVMGVNALLIKIIFDHDPDREFYIEESFPLAWMYPYLEPHGLIFKLNHEPLAHLSDDIVQRDHDFWVKTASPMIGDWLNNETPVKDISVFAERVFHQHDFIHFTGDPNFVQNFYSCRMFSKERSSSGGIYAWRAQHAVDPAEKQRMYDEADFAFRQSWALCPDLPEAVFRYVQFLMQTNRTDDALMVAQTAISLDPDNQPFSDLLKNLQRFKGASVSRPQTQSQAQSLEVEARANPSDYKNIFSLAGYYLQTQQTNRAAELLQQTISLPDVPADVLRGAAQVFARIADFPALKTTLEKLTVADPKPETWYDLARLEIRLGENDDAIKDLRIAIDLSDQRLQNNPQALDIRANVRTRPDFNSVRNRADFQQLISP